MHTRVCSYDRLGVGWSDPGPREISAGLLAEDLRRLLDAVQIREPIVIVASSIGGLTAEMVARRYPGSVAGLVFLDAANSEAIARRLNEGHLPLLVNLACAAARSTGSVGLVRLLDPWDLRHERTEQAARSAALMYGAQPWVMLCAMVRAWRTTLREFEAAPPLRRELPVTALSAESREALMPPALARRFGVPGGVVPGLRETHQHLALGSARGTWKVVPGSDHLIASSQPQAVVDAVLEMIFRLKAEATDW
jgi:pimeloyl-ACP methyl ester carboxylesterase